jgi:hypothetical protein
VRESTSHFATLASRINAARRIIGDNGERQRLIRTIIGKGVRFVGAVREQRVTGEPVAASILPRFSIVVLPFTNISNGARRFRHRSAGHSLASAHQSAEHYLRGRSVRRVLGRFASRPPIAPCATGRMAPHNDLWHSGEGAGRRARSRARCRSSRGQESGGADHPLPQGLPRNKFGTRIGTRRRNTAWYGTGLPRC